MAWLESVSDNLSPLLYNSILPLMIAILTVGLAWGIRPAVKFLLNRIGPTWSGLGATLVQVLVVLGGIALIVVAVGVNALLMVTAIGVAFLTGAIVGGENLLADRIAAMHIRRRKLYRVGDVVTLGNHYRGVVRKIGSTKTHIESPGAASVIVRNSLAVRRPIVIHQRPAAAITDMLPVQPDNTGADLPQPVIAPSTPSVSLSAKSNRAGTQVAGIPMHVAESFVVTSTDDTGQVEFAPSALALTVDGSVDLPQTEQFTEAPPTRGRAILSPVAVLLTKRAALGKRSVRDLR